MDNRRLDEHLSHLHSIAFWWAGANRRTYERAHREMGEIGSTIDRMLMGSGDKPPRRYRVSDPFKLYNKKEFVSLYLYLRDVPVSVQHPACKYMRAYVLHHGKKLIKAGVIDV